MVAMLREGKRERERERRGCILVMLMVVVIVEVLEGEVLKVKVLVEEVVVMGLKRAERRGKDGDKVSIRREHSSCGEFYSLYDPDYIRSSERGSQTAIELMAKRRLTERKTKEKEKGTKFEKFDVINYFRFKLSHLFAIFYFMINYAML